mmetsp:Transcript_146506/g.408146  ORF Transcript_146506/g.408146 Transcript_146506/m.408146 type:complete len:292 (+) Transcript_146506:310-1185(+)
MSQSVVPTVTGTNRCCCGGCCWSCCCAAGCACTVVLPAASGLCSLATAPAGRLWGRLGEAARGMLPLGHTLLGTAGLWMASMLLAGGELATSRVDTGVSHGARTITAASVCIRLLSLKARVRESGDMVRGVGTNGLPSGGEAAVLQPRQLVGGDTLGLTGMAKPTPCRCAMGDGGRLGEAAPLQSAAWHRLSLSWTWSASTREWKSPTMRWRSASSASTRGRRSPARRWMSAFRLASTDCVCLSAATVCAESLATNSDWISATSLRTREVNSTRKPASICPTSLANRLLVS